MKKLQHLTFVILSVSILSYGLSGVYAQETTVETPVAGPPISIELDRPTKQYDSGHKIVVKGKIRDLSAVTPYDVTCQIIGPDGNRVNFGQKSPTINGDYEFSFITGGPLWKTGEYTIQVNYGPQKATEIITFTSADEPPAPPPPPPPPEEPECEDDERLVNGECVKEEPECRDNEELVDGKCVEKEIECPTGQELVDGKCVDIPPPPPPPEPTSCPDGQKRVNGECVDDKPTPVCGAGTELNAQGQCVPIQEPDKTNGCLIATATYGSELAPQVQLLREVRDNKLLTTTSGMSFMTGFNHLYYSFSPTVADWERESPMFKEGVRAFITPMMYSLSIMTLADEGSDSQVLGLGLSVIALNLGMYIAAPTAVAFTVNRHFKSKRKSN